MGYNTTVVVLNDSLGEIAKDQDFGAKLARAISLAATGMPVDVPSGGHVSAATVIESHHADLTYVVSVGGNFGTVQCQVYGDRHHEADFKVKMLKEWAEKLGYTVRKKKKTIGDMLDDG